MRKQYHLLNGDALKEQFPESIEGEIIVARLCLVDGDVQAEGFSDLFQKRAKFISQQYEGFSEEDYYENTIGELQKTYAIEKEADINLWFEDDLFCQVNFWFILYLLQYSDKNNPTYLIRPKNHNQYGFGGLNASELEAAYANKVLLTEIDPLASLWKLYQKGDLENLLDTATTLQESHPYILAAVKAHKERIPTPENPGRPTQSLLQIMKELNTKDFGAVFKEFNKRESIYGFGDLQVKRLFDELAEGLDLLPKSEDRA